MRTGRRAAPAAEPLRPIGPAARIGPPMLAGVLLFGVSSCGGDGGPTQPDPEPPPDTATGALEVATATSGAEPDPDGYTITLDGDGEPRPIGVDDTVVVEGLDEGEHTIELSNLAPNCGVEGDNPRAVSVPAGDTATIDFAVACEGRSALEVTTSTVGGGLDPDGFRVAVDGGAERTIEPDGTETFAGLASGDHVVELSGLAPVCSLSGDNPRNVNAAVDDTTAVGFRATCGPSDPVFYSSRRDGNRDIYVTGADVPGSPMRLTDDPASEREPAVSPDGSRIAFVTRRDGGNPEIYVMAADGSGAPERLTDQAGDDGEPAWSPDGSRIAFVSGRDGSTAIWVVPADGSAAPTKLTPDDGGVARDDPDWSPDGSLIAYRWTSLDEPDTEIFATAADGSGSFVRLTDNGVDDLTPAWSPDGSRIAFSSGERGADLEILVMSVGGSDAVENLTRSPGIDVNPDWSRDGSHIVFTTGRDGDAEIYVMDADGSNPVNLTEHPANDFTPAWSP